MKITPKPDKNELADALNAMSQGQAQDPWAEDSAAQAHVTEPPAAASNAPAPMTPARPSAPRADAPAALSSVSSEDDDAVIVPPPDASAFAARRGTALEQALRSLHTRRMMIPILLTCGVLLPAIASLKWLASPVSVFALLDTWIAVGMALLGVVLLALAVMNMLQVRDQLRAAARPRTAAAAPQQSVR